MLWSEDLDDERIVERAGGESVWVIAPRPRKDILFLLSVSRLS